MAQTGKRRRERPLSMVKSASTYDKRLKIQKQAALNAAKVNKYRKLKAKLTADMTPTLPATEEAEQIQRADAEATSQATRSTEAREPLEQNAHKGRHQRRPKKPVPHIQRIAAEAQSKKAAQQAARDEALRLVREREAQRQRAMQRRKQQHASFRKKTKTGQPVMSVRIHKILGQLQTAA